MKIVVLEKDSAGTDLDLSEFESLGEVTYYGQLENEELKEAIRDAEILVVNKTVLNGEVLQYAERLQLIDEFATGYDNVDIAYCKEHGIRVCNVSNYSTESVAQHTFAMALFLLEKLSWYDHYVKSGEYSRQSNFTNFDQTFPQLYGKTWGIVGLGNIGKSVARIAQGFGCRVVYYSVTGKNTNTEYERVSFETLLKDSDVISLHCPLSPLTKYLIDYEALCRMKSSALLLNVARGQIVNSADLYRALEEGRIAAAGLDVLEHEPMAQDDPLRNIQDSGKLLITPHMGWASMEARGCLVHEACNNIRGFLSQNLRNVVV